MSQDVAIAFLKERFIRLTPRTCLNDPFEVLPTKKALDKIGNEHDAIQFQRYLDENGIISLTETHDNLLMWSHYCKEHSGLVFEFDIDIKNPFSLFNKTEHYEFIDSIFSKVSYRKNRHFLDFDSISKQEEIANYYYFSKSDEWIYEKEHRFVLPFYIVNKVILTPSKLPKKLANDLGLDSNEDSKTIIENDFSHIDLLYQVWQKSKENGAIFLLSVDKECIKNIYIGNNCDTGVIKEIVKNIKISLGSEMPYVNLYKSKIHPDRYELQFAKAN